MNRNIVIGLIYCFFGQILVWLQVNSQFVWPVTRRYTIPMAIISGPIIGLIFIYGAKFIIEGSNGQVWAARLIPAAMGTVIFTLMTWMFLKQGIEIKTLVCIILSIIILLIQIYWK